LKAAEITILKVLQSCETTMNKNVCYMYTFIQRITHSKNFRCLSCKNVFLS